jgi:hypothetical protein
MRLPTCASSVTITKTQSTPYNGGRAMTSIHKQVILTTVVCLFIGGLSAHAMSITVPNFSFESQSVGDGAYIIRPVTDWTDTGGPNDSYGVQNPMDAQYTGTTTGTLGNPLGTIPGGDGVQFLFVRKSSTASPETALATVPAANLIYTLTVAAGLRPDNNPMDSGTIGLTLDGFIVASTAISTTPAPAGTFEDYTVQYTTTAGDIGKSLSIFLQDSGSGGSSDNQVNFDNVRLDASSTSVVPEQSSTILLFGLGGLALWCARRWMRDDVRC